jgi:hypothetical protein
MCATSVAEGRHHRDTPVAQRDEPSCASVRSACRNDRARNTEKRAERELLQLGARRQPPFEDRGAHGIADARFRARLSCDFPLSLRHDGASIGPKVGPGQWNRGYVIMPILHTIRAGHRCIPVRSCAAAVPFGFADALAAAAAPERSPRRRRSGMQNSVRC